MEMSEVSEENAPAQITEELNSYSEFGALEYVLPSTDETKWVVGINGNMVHLSSIAEAIAFLNGAAAIVKLWTRVKAGGG